MNKVWVVTSGSYSDYDIEAVYSTSEAATEYVRRAGDQYRVEEFPLDEPIPTALYRVQMTKEGNIVWGTYPTINEESGFQCFNYAEPPELKWIVKTDNRERAIKVVNEKRAQILALNIWGDNEKVREMVK